MPRLECGDVPSRLKLQFSPDFPPECDSINRDMAINWDDASKTWKGALWDPSLGGWAMEFDFEILEQVAKPFEYRKRCTCLAVLKPLSGKTALHVKPGPTLGPPLDCFCEYPVDLAWVRL